MTVFEPSLFTFLFYVCKIKTVNMISLRLDNQPNASHDCAKFLGGLYHLTSLNIGTDAEGRKLNLGTEFYSTFALTASQLNVNNCHCALFSSVFL